MLKNPNIIFIVLDTHRRDRLGMYGYDRAISPNLDEFAAEATVYENAISPAQWTIPAHASFFSGEYASAHMTTQAGHALDPYFRTVAEWLREADYQRVGFCNNPLVGILDNDLKRGFDKFYNYGGAIPTLPPRSTRRTVTLLGKIWSRYTQLLRKISYPVQNAFARSDRMFQLSLNPLFVPMWTRFANFKGDTARSVEDATDYIVENMEPEQLNGRGQSGRPSQFVFINLMETHLPFTPPEPFLSRFAPTYKGDRVARDFMRVYNTQALRWLLPMDEPLSELEMQTLSELYDAEVAYQDHLLNELLETLSSPYHRENSLVVLVADHGEMLGEHDLMGHSFQVYQELVQVPMIVRFPGQERGLRIRESVSSLQLFHTIMDYAGVDVGNYPHDAPGMDEGEYLANRIEQLSLRRNGALEPAPSPVFSEAFPPQNVIKIMEEGSPDLLERFHSRSIFRAVYDQSAYKLVRADGLGDRLFNLKQDPNEKLPLADAASSPRSHYLAASLERFLETIEARRPDKWSRRGVSIADDKVAQRLRALGYLE
ncbi:sulfatase [Chloroflexota bacterium]